MNKLGKLIRDWMLPFAIVLGIGLYLAYHFSPALHAYGKWLHPMASEGQRLVIATLLFFQFVKISPHELKVTRWHLKALTLQVGLFLSLGFGNLTDKYRLNLKRKERTEEEKQDSAGDVPGIEESREPAEAEEEEKAEESAERESAERESAENESAEGGRNGETEE